MLPECWAKCRYEDGLVWQSPCGVCSTRAVHWTPGCLLSIAEVSRGKQMHSRSDQKPQRVQMHLHHQSLGRKTDRAELQHRGDIRMSNRWLDSQSCMLDDRSPVPLAEASALL